MLGIRDHELYEQCLRCNETRKVIFRLRGFRACRMGNHDVKMWFKRSAHTADIRLYHYHIPNYAGFESRVARWEKSIFLMKPGHGEHMKKQVIAYREGRLRKLYDDQFGEEIRKRLMEWGVVVRDESVHRFLQFLHLR